MGIYSDAYRRFQDKALYENCDEGVLILDMKAYYKTKPKHRPSEWTSLQLNKEDFEYLYDSALFKYLSKIDEENTAKSHMIDLEKQKESVF